MSKDLSSNDTDIQISSFQMEAKGFFPLKFPASFRKWQLAASFVTICKAKFINVSQVKLL
jgi:hypothetical protein